MLYIVAILTFVAAVTLWLTVTAPFIREAGEDADTNYMGMYLAVFFHFLFPISVGFSKKRPVPFGV